MGASASKKDKLLFKYPRRPRDAYVGDLPKYTYNECFNAELADYSLEHNLLDKNDIINMSHCHSYNYNRKMWITDNLNKLLEKNVLCITDNIFRMICFTNYKLFTTHITSIQNYK